MAYFVFFLRQNCLLNRFEEKSERSGEDGSENPWRKGEYSAQPTSFAGVIETRIESDRSVEITVFSYGEYPGSRELPACKFRKFCLV